MKIVFLLVLAMLRGIATWRSHRVERPLRPHNPDAWQCPCLRCS